MINVIKTAIEGVVIIEPKVFGDARGYFFESFSERDFNEAMTPILGHGIKFVQDNESMSTYGVLRGLHFQTPPFTQSKLVRCVKGAVLDVAVDIRKGSHTYGQHVAVELTEDNHRQFFVPRGFAHGFAVLSEIAVFQYKCDNFYASQAVADTMNYKLDGYVYKVNVNDQRGYQGNVSDDYYDETNNQSYYLVDHYNYDTNTHNATIFTDKPALTLTANETYYTGTLTIANATANVTITKK